MLQQMSVVPVPHGIEGKGVLMCLECGVAPSFDEEDVREAVSRGIALLDTYGPSDWRLRVDLSTLNMDSPYGCILGQIYSGMEVGRSGFSAGLHILSQFTYFGARECGFDGSLAWLDACGEEWKRQLTTVTVPEREEC